MSIVKSFLVFIIHLSFTTHNVVYAGYLTDSMNNKQPLEPLSKNKQIMNTVLSDFEQTVFIPI